MTENVVLRYFGGAVEVGEMEAYETATNIIAFTDFLGICSRAAFGENARLKSRVRAIEKGSFSIEFAIELGGFIATLMSGPLTPRDLFDLVKEAFSAFKHLGGMPPQQITRNGHDFRITNNAGHVKIFNGPVVTVIQDPRAGLAAERFVRRPLVNDADGMTVETSSGEMIAEVTREEADSFVPISAEDPITQSEIRMALEIISPVFKRRGKWRFSDGQHSFWAEILDESFWNRVDSGEAFAKGDYLVVLMRVAQTVLGDGLHIERTIMSVIEHQRRPEQPSLL